MLTITRYIVVPESATIHCYYDSDGTTEPVGTNLHAQLSELEAPLDGDAWSNADLRKALAKSRGCLLSQVKVAPIPPTPEPEPDSE